MHRRTRQRVAVAALCVVGLLAIGLSGCAIQQETPVTDAEAHDRFLAALDDTQDIVGGEWEVLDDPTPRECVIPLWITALGCIALFFFADRLYDMLAPIVS